MFKKLLVIFALLSIFLCGCAQKEEPVVEDLTVIKDRGKLIVGVRDDTKPFGYRDAEGKLVGFDIELAQKIAEKILKDKSKIEFVTVNADDRITLLNSKKVDILVATMTITQQRLRVIDFSEAYYVAGQAVLVNKKSPYTTINELADKKIGVVFGTTGEKTLRDIYPLSKILGYKNYSDAYLALKNKEIEALVADDTVLLGFAMEDKTIRLLEKRYSREPYGVAFRQGVESQSLQLEVNELINYLISTGKLKQIMYKYKLL